MCVVNTPDENIALRDTEHSEMSAITPTDEKNGKINPALKFSADDLPILQGKDYEYEKNLSPDMYTEK
jgi:hypothetical protein